MIEVQLIGAGHVFIGCYFYFIFTVLVDYRQVLERSITLQLPAKKMKTMFQKFLEFETQHGSEERQNYVRQKALEYVEAKSEAKE